jgi:aspartate 1-decarboxylase
MQIEVMKSKIHRVKVTEADLHYVGSITLDEELMEAANLVEHEKVQVLNIENGARLFTYVLKAEKGSGTVCMNGPAARKMTVGDTIIIIAYARMGQQEAKQFEPTVIFPDKNNRLTD